MARYRVTVFERSVQECEYEVEADSAEEAKQSALEGTYEERECVHPGDRATTLCAWRDENNRGSSPKAFAVAQFCSGAGAL
jgi:hypothetical protein